jgi:parallel beta-helix repeat protein
VRPLLALVPVAAALALWLGGAPARAETTGCTTIDSLPATLAAPGHYCLATNLSVTGTGTTAITVSAPNVVLDCNDHRVLAATAGSNAAGVHLEAPAIGAVVRNCRIEGFYYGISSAYSASAQPRSAQLLGNRISRSNLAGIFLYGSGNLIEGNIISDGQRLAAGYPTGIYLPGGDPGDYAVGNVIRGNTVQEFRPPTPTDGSYNLSIGISILYQRNALIEDNTIIGLHARTGGGAYGISSGASRELEVRGNRVLSVAPEAAPFDGGSWAGVFLQGSAEELASNNCTDNLVGHFNGNFTGCGTTSANTGF